MMFSSLHEDIIQGYAYVHYAVVQNIIIDLDVHVYVYLL